MLKRWGHFDKTGRLSFLGAAVSLILTFMLPAHSNADMLTIDEIIFQDGGVDSSVLAGTADASLLPGDILRIYLTNTSTDVTGGDAATNLLTGIGFNLPPSVQVNFFGGASSISITPGSLPVNFFAPLTQNTWGGTNTVNSGPFQDVTTLVVDTVVATLQAAIAFDFAGTAVPPGGTANVNGPSYGLLSGDPNVPPATAGGLEAIRDSVTLLLKLNGLDGFPGAELLTFINDNPVVLAFGSPDSARTPGTPIPEPGTLLLIGSGLVGLGAGLWRRKKY